MKLAALIIGIFSATIVLFGGCAGACTGVFFSEVEESLEADFDEGSEGSSIEEVTGGGLIAILAGVLLYIGSALTFATRKTSTIVNGIGTLLVLFAIVADTWSAFAAAYYIGLVLAGVSTGLLTMVWVKKI